MFIYVGPDQLIPFTGFMGTAAGLAMIFWGKLVAGIRKLALSLSGKAPAKISQDR